MQIESLEVAGLFGGFDRSVRFPTHVDGEDDLSLVILHGPNGSGKTTALRMIDGLMTLDFDVFRKIPFSSCRLKFSDGEVLSVVNDRDNAELKVSFGKLAVPLSYDAAGATAGNQSAVEEFRTAFFKASESITFEYIHTQRVAPDEDESTNRLVRDGNEWRMRSLKFAKSERGLLAERVRRFISEVQVDSRRFLRSSEPDFLSAIIERLKLGEESTAECEGLLDRLDQVRVQDAQNVRLGLQGDHWDSEIAAAYLGEQRPSSHGLVVMEAATEVLESRARGRAQIAERLLEFEQTINGYFTDKEVRIDARHGFQIDGPFGGVLPEKKLSSGEYHLLFILVSALTTRRRGTVLAIDEPELSMHISWQRSLISSILRCSAKSSPQLLLATHSPDIVGEYREFLTPFGSASDAER